MNVLIDIGHPAHVHLFKNLIWHLKSRGDTVFVAARNKDIVVDLLNHYQIEHEVLSTSRKKLLGLFSELVKRNLKLIRMNKKYDFDLALGTSVSIAHLTALCGVPSYNFNEDDDDYIPLYTFITYPFTTKIINPEGLIHHRWTSKRVFYPSYHELAYLHPDHFQADIDVVKHYDLVPQKYIIVRLSALAAHHDLTAAGISKKMEDQIADLAKDYRIIYSREVTKENRIKPWDMHHVLAYAKMLISDSQSMSIEAAVLGVPSVRLSSFVGRSSVLENLEHKYNLTFGYSPGDEVGFLSKITELLTRDNLSAEWQQKKERLLNDKVDFNQWMINYIESIEKL
jgi:predicted glycosyltransferase